MGSVAVEAPPAPEDALWPRIGRIRTKGEGKLWLSNIAEVQVH